MRKLTSCQSYGLSMVSDTRCNPYKILRMEESCPDRPAPPTFRLSRRLQTCTRALVIRKNAHISLFLLLPGALFLEYAVSFACSYGHTWASS